MRTPSTTPLLLLTILALAVAGCATTPTGEGVPTAAVVPAAEAAAVAEDPAAQCAAGDPLACLSLCQQQAEACGDDKGECNRVVASTPACADEAVELGSLCTLAATAIKPTQASLGQVAAQCRAAKISSKDTPKGKKLQRYLLQRPVPAVLGPDDRFYITDRHHLSWGVLNAEVASDRKRLFVCPMADRSGASAEEFWAYMEEPIPGQPTRFTWLKDRYGKEIAPAALPSDLAGLADDPYRTLSRWVRNSCGYLKCDSGCANASCPSPYYLEFIWGDFMGDAFDDPAVYDMPRDHQIAWLRDNLDDPRGGRGAIQIVNAAAASKMPGFNGGQTAIAKVTIDAETGCEE